MPKIETKQIDYKFHPITYLMFNGEKQYSITPEESKNVKSVIITERLSENELKTRDLMVWKYYL